MIVVMDVHFSTVGFIVFVDIVHLNISLFFLLRIVDIKILTCHLRECVTKFFRIITY